MSNLIVKQKLSYSLTGTSVSIPFSLLGSQSETIQYIGILLKCEGQYTVRIKDRSGTLIAERQNKGDGYHICTLGGNLNLTCPNIYSVEGESLVPLSIFELNLATLCLCESS